MKRLFLCMGLLGGSLVHAQHNDFFDADKLIRERLQKQHTPLLAPLQTAPQIRTLITGTPFQIQIPAITLANGNRVQILSQDHMPCVIPAPATAGLIPNAGNTSQLTYTLPAAIPNSGRKEANSF